MDVSQSLPSKVGGEPIESPQLLLDIRFSSDSLPLQVTN